MSTARHPAISRLSDALAATGDPGLGNAFEAGEYGTQPVTVEDYDAGQALEQAEDEMAARAKELAAAARERAEIEALADAMNSVERMRDRNGRRVFAPLDAKATNEIWRILKGLGGADTGADGDAVWR